jgi:hypothetical protein
MKELAFLQERDDRFSAADAKRVVRPPKPSDHFALPFLDLLFAVVAFMDEHRRK